MFVLSVWVVFIKVALGAFKILFRRLMGVMFIEIRTFVLLVNKAFIEKLVICALKLLKKPRIVLYIVPKRVLLSVFSASLLFTYKITSANREKEETKTAKHIKYPKTAVKHALKTTFSQKTT